MKKYIACLAAFVLLLTGCAAGADAPAEKQESGKLSVIATLFPQYDFARAIAGERAKVIQLLPAGADSHSYEPSPSELVAIASCDVFLYTGAEMEPWAEKLIGSALSGAAVDLSEGIDLSETASVTPDADAKKHEDSHHHVVDPHIWTSPKNAKQMAQTVLSALIAADPDGESHYRKNAEEYFSELDALDTEIREIVQSGARNEMVFGSRFAFHYFAEEYGLSCFAAYDSCSEENEASAGAVAGIIDLVKEKDIPVIYHEEMTDPKVARVIAEETGAELLMLHSCHNLSKAEREAGETYLSLMRQNAENLRKGLM